MALRTIRTVTIRSAGHLPAHCVVQRYPHQRGGQACVAARRQGAEFRGVAGQLQLVGRRNGAIVEVGSHPSPHVLHFAQEDGGTGVTNPFELLKYSCGGADIVLTALREVGEAGSRPAPNTSRAARIAVATTIGLLASTHSTSSWNSGIGLSSIRIPASSAWVVPAAVPAVVVADTLWQDEPGFSCGPSGRATTIRDA
jgi:hypothetical protein